MKREYVAELVQRLNDVPDDNPRWGETKRLAREWLKMREALEEIAGYEIGDKGTCDINLYHCVMDARQALKETDGETK